MKNSRNKDHTKIIESTEFLKFLIVLNLCLSSFAYQIRINVLLLYSYFSFVDVLQRYFSYCDLYAAIGGPSLEINSILFYSILTSDNLEHHCQFVTIKRFTNGIKNKKRLFLMDFFFIFYHSILLSRVKRKTCFFICVNKDADQLHGNRADDQHLWFRFIDSTIPLLSKSEISSL